MVLVVAEKPSVGRDIARVIGANTREKGYLSGNSYIVTWCIGHLIRLAMPDEIDPALKAWDIATLPILPRIIPHNVINDVKDQFEIVKKLINDKSVTELINAGDAGREGEYIQRLVYTMAGNKKPVKRLWISSMTDQAIRDGFKHLQDDSDYDNLFMSAKCRSEADWLVGLNATRLYSIKYNSKLNVGRVQTPTVAMIVKRQEEIDNFVSVPFYEIEADFDTFKAKWFNGNGTSFEKRPDAEAIVQKCQGKPGKITELTKEKKSAERPLLYDLNELQRDANRIFGYTAQQTLNIAQALYETHKLTTYPRTESRYLTTDVKNELPGLLNNIKAGYSAAKQFVDKIMAQGINSDKRVIDNSQVGDHHAIIVTSNIAKYASLSLSPEENNVLRLIVTRLLAVLDQKMIYEQTDAVIEIEGEHFKSTGKKLISFGWRETEIGMLGKKARGSSDNIITGNKGDTVKPKQLLILDEKTTPPKLYTEATLLTAMENVDRQLSNSTLKSVMKEAKGIGTPATRSNIIENIIKTGYIVREKKALKPTDKGKNLIKVVPEKLKMPDFTAAWEERLKDIKDGKENPNAFMSDIRKYVTEIVKDVSSAAPVSSVSFAAQCGGAKNVIGRCPRCGKPIYEGTKSFYCSGYKDNPKCEFALWKDNKWLAEKGKKMTATLAKALLSKPKVFVKGFKSKKTGKTYDAYLSLDDAGKYVNFKMEFADNR